MREMVEQSIFKIIQPLDIYNPGHLGSTKLLYGINVDTSVTSNIQYLSSTLVLTVG